jgi:formylglycine-generating enzyme required for sulfatase activity
MLKHEPTPRSFTNWRYHVTTTGNSWALGCVLLSLSGCRDGQGSAETSKAAEAEGVPAPAAMPPAPPSAAPKCTDGIRNGNERDVDCGAACRMPCRAGQHCIIHADCESVRCSAGVCSLPNANDGLKNGSETDVDCGGSPENPRCRANLNCARGSDCESNACGKSGTEFAGMCLVAPSCVGGTGANHACGNTRDQSCCDAPMVVGGSYLRYQSVTRPATVHSFHLDRFEVTVARIRAFLLAAADVDGNLRGRYRLRPGQGAHPRIAKSGWRESFEARLPGSLHEASERFTSECAFGGDSNDWGAPTWTDAPGANDEKPINCIDWYTLFAFCIWDGGRLPTDAEWGYAAGGGPANWAWPWGDEVPEYPAANTWLAAGLLDRSDGLYKFTVGTPFGSPTDGTSHIARVGEKTARTTWGQADMVGNMIELLLDYGVNTEGNCMDCASVSWPDPPQASGQPRSWRVVDAQGVSTNGATQPDGGRLIRGGSWHPDHPASNFYGLGNYPTWRTYYALGGRCAR